MDTIKFILVILVAYLLYYCVVLLNDLIKKGGQTALSTDTGNTFYIPGADIHEKPTQVVNGHSVNRFVQPETLSPSNGGNIEKNSQDAITGYCANENAVEKMHDMGLYVDKADGLLFGDANILTMAKKLL